MTDFTLQNDGPVSILTPLSEAAKKWAEEHLPEDALHWGTGIAIEHRFVAMIINGLVADGLTVGTDMTR